MREKYTVSENSPTVHGYSEFNSGLSAFLDAARWISAFFVLITHLNNRMFVTLHLIPSSERTITSYLWGFVTGFAHWGVVVFFVLSGFLVGGPVLRAALNKSNFNSKKYIVARVTRIYLVLIPVLIIGNGLDYLGMDLFPSSVVYSEHLIKLMGQSDLQFNMSIFGSVLNLQNLFFDTLGTNGPLETLANEFWYYMTFPLLLAPVFYNKSVKGYGLFALGFALLISMSLASKWHFIGFILWGLGALFFVKKENVLIKSPLAAFIFFLLVLIGIRLGVRSEVIFGAFGFLFEIIVAILFANVLCSLRFREVNWVILRSSWHAKLGGFSYSLYAVHVPLLMFMCSVLKDNFGYGWHDVPRYGYQWLTALIFVVICISFAWLLSLITEKHTYKVRKYIYGLID
ncbi:acyltransferase family protein [Methylomonas sp. MK1]|uniref:acyltransferase family protein n=1 Tax=Methylomonas sp. MK1 TaxID=1131552 RepID=UPI00036AE51E|nr:acyltransferase [Methylomonas sp. MK1]